MKIIAIISEKGGAGKTTLAVNLAVAAEAHGLATAIFDLDPRANSTVWGDSRPTRFPPLFRRKRRGFRSCLNRRAVTTPTLY